MTTLVMLLVITASQSTYAQVWMQGYNFRKKITIDKSKVSGTANLLNFNVLIDIHAPGLMDPPGCEQELKNGLPISFSSATQPDVPIDFQLDHYDPITGKLLCWLQITELIAGTNPGFNEVYFYYGSKEVHDPPSTSSRSIWTGHYQQVWHLNHDAEPAISASANCPSGNVVTGNAGMSALNFTQGQIGKGVVFNGSSDGMTSFIDSSQTLNVSTWIKLSTIGREQVVLANDSEGYGWQLKINELGKVIFTIINAGMPVNHVTIDTLALETWTYLVIQLSMGQKRIYINGQYAGGGGPALLRVGSRTSLNIGRGTQNDHYFHGMIDELRIAAIGQTADWILTEYRNQRDPTAFVNLSAQEVNPIQLSTANEFIDVNGTGQWEDEINWSFGRLPDKCTDVTIKTGKQTEIGAGHSVSVKSLCLESGAKIILSGDLEVNCMASLTFSSSILLQENAKIIFKNDVLNDGLIHSGQYNGTMVFNGAQPLHTFSGSGMVRMANLNIDLMSLPNTLLLNAKIEVGQQLNLLKGTLNANGNLTLLALGENSYATVLPVDAINGGRITGNVKVQQFIAGNFLAPSTARGWRLLSSPVYQSSEVSMEYNLQAIQDRIFVTGPAGVTNGFDPSPNNNPTIYTHNQALSGTLSQKYIGIPNMSAKVALGKGFYVFSRGDRSELNAYESQVLHPPFSIPQAYVLNYTGKLFTGDLKVDLFNSNTGEEGDGFNLLGNPYASAIRWGNLKKINVLPFIWVFDPKNSAYHVTDDPEYIIPTGTGFFVKVNSDDSTGTITFTEGAKYWGTSTARMNRSTSAGKLDQLKDKEVKTIVKVSVRKDGLSDNYILALLPGGKDEMTDADAIKIGEGHLSISGLTTQGVKLAIDERRVDTATRTIELFVKGWNSGVYTLSFKGSLNNYEQVTLVDHYLNQQMNINETEELYTFSIDMTNSATYGKGRFSLQIQQLKRTISESTQTNKAFLVYPNPVNDLIYIKSTSQSWGKLKAIIRTVTGQVIWTVDLASLRPEMPVQLRFDQFKKGLYILQLIDQEKNETISFFKILKN